jgi:hypothetical protein
MPNLIITKGLGSDQLLICKGYGAIIEVVEELLLTVAQCISRRIKPTGIVRKVMPIIITRRGDC